MTRKNRNDLNGWLILDKPAGPSSTQALGRARWLLNAAKGGHGGTLDPFATGVLPLAFGDATKLISHVLDGSKSYRFGVRWGEERDTDDLTGTVTRQSPARPSREAILAALPSFTGTFQQMPPRYSALHVDGERAYDLARAGKEVPLQPRTVTLTRLELLDMPSPDEALFEADCSKGTYIRSLARDLGARLGCFAHVNLLNRLRSGPFGLESAIPLEKLEEIVQKGAGLNDLQALLLPLGSVLDDIPALSVNEQEARKLRQGQSIMLHPLRLTPQLQNAGTVRIIDRYGLVALGELTADGIKPMRVFKPHS